MGKNKVIGVALGVDEETSYKTNSYRVTEVYCHKFRISKDIVHCSLQIKLKKNANKYSIISKNNSLQLEE